MQFKEVNVHVVNSPSRERWRFADPASWLVTVKENVLVANILSFSKRAPSSPDNMTSQEEANMKCRGHAVPHEALLKNNNKKKRKEFRRA